MYSSLGYEPNAYEQSPFPAYEHNAYEQSSLNAYEQKHGMHAHEHAPEKRKYGIVCSSALPLSAHERATNQPTNQPINQPTNQPINQSSARDATPHSSREYGFVTPAHQPNANGPVIYQDKSSIYHGLPRPPTPAPPGPLFSRASVNIIRHTDNRRANAHHSAPPGPLFPRASVGIVRHTDTRRASAHHSISPSHQGLVASIHLSQSSRSSHQGSVASTHLSQSSGLSSLSAASVHASLSAASIHSSLSAASIHGSLSPPPSQHSSQSSQHGSLAGSRSSRLSVRSLTRHNVEQIAHEATAKANEASAAANAKLSEQVQRMSAMLENLALDRVKTDQNLALDRIKTDRHLAKAARREARRNDYIEGASGVEPWVTEAILADHLKLTHQWWSTERNQWETPRETTIRNRVYQHMKAQVPKDMYSQCPYGDVKAIYLNIISMGKEESASQILSLEAELSSTTKAGKSMITWLNALYEIFSQLSILEQPKTVAQIRLLNKSINPSNPTRDMNMSYAILSATKHGQSSRFDRLSKRKPPPLTTY